MDGMTPQRNELSPRPRLTGKPRQIPKEDGVIDRRNGGGSLGNKSRHERGPKPLGDPVRNGGWDRLVLT